MDRPSVEQVKAEPAGRRLDGWVAELVMGLAPRDVRVRGGDATVRMHTANPYFADGACDRAELERWAVPAAYSADPAAAWAVMDRVGHSLLMPGGTGQAHRTLVRAYCWAEPRDGQGGFAVPGEGETMPLAVCRAALLAVLEATP